MKVSITAESQEEFNSKRYELIKSIAGAAYNVDLRPKGESLSTEPRQPFYRAQAEMLDFWNNQFEDMLNAIKSDVHDIINKN